MPTETLPRADAASHGGLLALAEALGLAVGLGGPSPCRPGGRRLVVAPAGVLDVAATGALAEAAAAGDHVIVAAGPGARPLPAGAVAFTTVLALPSATDPLVLDAHLCAHGVGPFRGRRIEADDLVAVDLPGGEPLFEAAGQVVAQRVAWGAGTITVIGSVAMVADRWLSAADNAAVLALLATGRDAPHDADIAPTTDSGAGATSDTRTDADARSAADTGPATGTVATRSGRPDLAAAALVAAYRPAAARPGGHAAVPSVDVPAADWAALVAAVPGLTLHDPQLVRAAGRARRLLPAPVHDALVDLADDAGPVGALLLRGVPTGRVPATPSSPTHRPPTTGTSEFALLAVARALGQPVGFAPEHGGRLVQDLLPTPDGATRQTSTSSAVELEFHTETAFHPHRPRYLLLLCLRSDPAAQTLLCSIHQVLDHLPLAVRRVLSEPRYRTGVDESFAAVHRGALGRPVPVLSGDPARPTLTFDADLMVGTDAEAERALIELRDVALAHRLALTLAAGDLLVVDNHACIHGRSAFPARYDGTDRWLQRSFVVADLAASAGARDGRVITTRFA